MQQKQEQMRTADTVMKTLAQLPKASYFKEKELFKDNSQAPITSRQIAEKLVLRRNLNKTLQNSLEKTDVWKNDYQVYRLQGSGSLRSSSSRLSSGSRQSSE
jgi:hypothetical protein